MLELLKKTEEKALSGIGLTREEAICFTESPAEDILNALPHTNRIREHFKGREVNLCGIVSAKSGLCKEDCSFCAQSVKYSANSPEYPMISAEEMAKKAEEASLMGAREFSIVTSGSRISKGSDMEKLQGAISMINHDTGVETCASLGMMEEAALKELKAAGLHSYHHNLETSRSFFPKVCTTHSYDEDVATIKAAKKTGLYACSGGIFGLGESWKDRVELTETLRELDVDCVPINFLNPRPGTPLEHSKNLTPFECLKIIALIRLMLPAKDIIVCGGREVNLRSLQPLIFAAGANGMMIGNYLTTKGRPPEEDLKMLSDLGLTPRK